MSIALFFVGVLASPSFDSADQSDDITQTTSSENKDKSNSSTNPETSATKTEGSTNETNVSTTKINNSTTEKKVEMVWVSSSGTKYHSKSTCSNMNSPRQISLEDAQNGGYTACSRCH